MDIPPCTLTAYVWKCAVRVLRPATGRPYVRAFSLSGTVPAFTCDCLRFVCVFTPRPKVDLSSKALRNPQKVDLCVLASFSCRVYAETQGRKVRPVVGFRNLLNCILCHFIAVNAVQRVSFGQHFMWHLLLKLIVWDWRLDIFLVGKSRKCSLV